MTYERRGAPITIERWWIEKEANGSSDIKTLGDWIEFKDHNAQTILKIDFAFWERLGFEVQGRIFDEMRKYYG